MEHGDLFLLCCDGLTDLVEDWMIREILTSEETLDAIAENLVRAANANGGSDNITVIVIAVFSERKMFDGPGVSKTTPGYKVG